MAVDTHRAAYWADVEALATETCPPLDLFEHGRDWLQIGKGLRQVYGLAVRDALAPVDKVDEGGIHPRSSQRFDAARQASERYLEQWPTEKQGYILLGAAAAIYAAGCRDGQPPNDLLLWQLGRRREGIWGEPGTGREPGIAQAFVGVLREIGLLGEPVWTTQGTALHYSNSARAHCAGIPISFKGTWYNWLRITRPETPASMAQVPTTRRAWAKARLAEMATTQFVGLRLTTQVTDDARVVAWTEHGNLFGYVARGQELQAIRQPVWEVAWAMAIDGNVNAILKPASS